MWKYFKPKSKWSIWTQQIVNNDEISLSEKIADVACHYENGSKLGHKKDEIAHLYVSTDSHHVLGNTIWSAGQQNQTAVDPFHPQIPGIINEHKEIAYLYDMQVCLVYHMFP